MPIILKENECVHCKTQEEFDVVNEILSKQFGRKHENYLWKREKEKTCIANHPEFGYGYSRIEFYKEQKFKIYSFKEFMNVKEEKTYTQKEVDVIIAETRQKTIDEIIERLETLNSTDSLLTVNNYRNNNRCNNCGRFINKTIGCQYCI